MKRLVLIAASLLASVAHAQSAPQVNAEVNYSWTLPTTNTNGSTIPTTGPSALKKLQLFVSNSPIADALFIPQATAELASTATSFKYTTTVPNGTTLYARLKACNAVDICSGYSGEAVKKLDVDIPGVPTGFTVTVTVTVVVPAKAAP